MRITGIDPIVTIRPRLINRRRCPARRVSGRSRPERVAMEPGDAFRVHAGHELSRMAMRWRSTRPGRPACQIVCR